MLRYRLIFGPIMILLGIGLFYLDDQLDRLDLSNTQIQPLVWGRTYLPSGLLLLVVLFFLIAMTAREIKAIFAAKGVPAESFMIALAGILGAGLLYIIPHQVDSQAALAIAASLMILVFILALLRHAWRKRTEGAVIAASVAMFGFIYLGAMPGFYLAIRRWHAAWVVLAILAITKMCDIGAYFVGRAAGRHKLIPWLSPGKTWEGLVGGLLCSAGLAVGLAAWSNAEGYSGQWVGTGASREFVFQAIPLWFAAIAGVVLGFVGQIGDLTASLFKRDAGIKDSGQAVPGFGGLLDIVDSPILVAPVAYWLLRLVYAL